MDPTVVTTIATVAIASIATVQIWREVRHTYKAKKTAVRKLCGAAWLARRSCELTLRVSHGAQNQHALADEYDRSPSLDRLQGHFREVLELSAEVGGKTADTGIAAFGAFLAATDRFQEVRNPTSTDNISLGRGTELADEALTYLHQAVQSLEPLAPRQSSEPPLASPHAFRDSANRSRVNRAKEAGGELLEPGR